MGGGIGCDYQVTDAWLMGFCTGLSNGYADHATLASTEFGGLYTALYTSCEQERWYVDGILSVAKLKYQNHRQLTGGNNHDYSYGQFPGRDVSAYVELGLYGGLFGKWQAQPLLGMRYAHVNLDGYDEIGHENVTSFDDQHYESFRSSVGMTWSRPLFEQGLGFQGNVLIRARWNHEFRDTQSIVGVSMEKGPESLVTVADARVPRNRLALGGDMHLAMNKTMQLRMSYDTRFDRSQQSHLLTGFVEFRW